MISDITVERTSEGVFRIYWKSNGDPPEVVIYRGDAPGAMERTSAAARVKNGNCAEIKGLDPVVRHYFEVLPAGGEGIITAERRVPLQGAINFRDLGGYETGNGRRVKWGRIFRSDSLARLTPEDQEVLKKLGVKLVCDFRTPNEVSKAPDRLPDGAIIEYLHLPLMRGEFDPAAAFERMKQGDISWMTSEFLINGYLENIEAFADTWGTIFERLVDPQSLPLVFHCTGGKDRAGTCAALILLALGVPEETVIEDHALSNVFIADILERIFDHVRSFGIDADSVAPYFSAPRECIEALLDHIRRKYGSVDGYLKTQAGVSVKTLSQLKELLLD
ncbi:tyrosine-protein phosphatase [Thermodesulfobacteriota bacterium]